MYTVILHNDDFTPGFWVVDVIEKVFHKNRMEAMEITMRVHTRGFGVIGVYSHEIAETKIGIVLDLARREGHPLIVTMESE